MLAVGSLAIPLGIGFALSGTLAGALTALLWAGLVRMALLHHVTWSVNSLCHTFGRRPERTADRSTNLWPLAVVSLGDNWHNIHHAHPSWARHGAGRGMVDPSAWLIRRFEQLGWATRVRWPTDPTIAKGEVPGQPGAAACRRSGGRVGGGCRRSGRPARSSPVASAMRRTACSNAASVWAEGRLDTADLADVLAGGRLDLLDGGPGSRPRSVVMFGT